MRASTAVCPVLCRCSRRISRRWWMSKCSAVRPVWCDPCQGSLLQGGVGSGAQHLCGSRVSLSHVRWFDAFEPGERAGALFGMRTGWCFWCSELAVLLGIKTTILLRAVPRRASGRCPWCRTAAVCTPASLSSLVVQCCNSFCMYPCICPAVVCVCGVVSCCNSWPVDGFVNSKLGFRAFCLKTKLWLIFG
jgi:hypothetical protein